MTQRGIKYLFFIILSFLFACTPKNKKDDSAYQYTNHVFVGDIIFDSPSYNNDHLIQELKTGLSNIGKLQEQKMKSDNSNAILLVCISPLFIQADSDSSNDNNLIEIQLKLLAPANLAEKKDITIKGLIWEKRSILNNTAPNFDTELQKRLSEDLLELKEHYNSAGIVPTFYL